MNDDEALAAILLAAQTLLAQRDASAPATQARWRLAGRLDDASAHARRAPSGSRWIAVGRLT